MDIPPSDTESFDRETLASIRSTNAIPSNEIMLLIITITIRRLGAESTPCWIVTASTTNHLNIHGQTHNPVDRHDHHILGNLVDFRKPRNKTCSLTGSLARLDNIKANQGNLLTLKLCGNARAIYGNLDHWIPAFWECMIPAGCTHLGCTERIPRYPVTHYRAEAAKDAKKSESDLRPAAFSGSTIPEASQKPRNTSQRASKPFG